MFAKPSRDVRKKYEKFLAPGEELEYVAKIGDRYYYSMMFSGVSTFAMLAPMILLSTHIQLFPLWLGTLFSVSSLIGLWPILKVGPLRHSLRYIFTSRRIIIKEGIFSLNVTTAPYDKITHIVIRQTLVNRMFYGAGSIILHTAGPTPVEMELIHIEQPFAVKNLLEQLIHEERKLSSSPVAQPWPQADMNEVLSIEN